MTAYEDYNPTGYTAAEIATPDYARIAVLQTERAYLDRELVRAGNHSHTVKSILNDRLTAVDAVIQKELPL